MFDYDDELASATGDTAEVYDSSAHFRMVASRRRPYRARSSEED